MENQQKLRAGRIADLERLTILTELAKIVSERYNHNLIHNGSGYNLELLKNSVQFGPDIDAFENYYWIDTGSEDLDTIAEYFEYGTGLYNTQYRKKDRGVIVPRVKSAMKFLAKNGKIAFAKEVKGVKPIYMLRKAVKSVEFDRKYLQREIRFDQEI